MFEVGDLVEIDKEKKSKIYLSEIDIKAPWILDEIGLLIGWDNTWGKWKVWFNGVSHYELLYPEQIKLVD